MQNPERHPGYARLFRPSRLTLGVFFAIEGYRGDTPSLRGQEALASRAEALGFSALWFRDVPLRDPSFGDVGQVYDPWVYLAYIGSRTEHIALATGAIVLPLRHPLHVAKAAASVDVLTGGRLVLGVASGDRASEYAAFGSDHAARGATFREHLAVMRRAWTESFPELDGPSGRLTGLDPIPKPLLGDLPVLVTGRSQQTLGFIAANADGFVTYPRAPTRQAELLADLRAAAAESGIESVPPMAQSLYIDLLERPDAFEGNIHLGYALGRERLIELLDGYQKIGVAHVVFNLKYCQRPAKEVLEELGAEVVPHFCARAENLAAE